MTEKILQVSDLTTSFHTEEGVIQAVDESSFALHKGESLGIVGESGSGKSVTAYSIMQFIENPGTIENGSILYKGEELTEKSEKEMEEIRGGEISMIMQDPLSALNPVYTVGEQIGRVIRQHSGVSKKAAREETIELLEKVGIPEPESRIDDYPHQFSGGMCQRALIAMAIACEPDILIADEPSTALDVTIEAQIFEKLAELQEEYDMSLILITHDLGVVADVCDRVLVQYAGEIIEKATVEELFKDPRHPYTRGLLRSLPRITGDSQRLNPIEGSPPDLSSLPKGCNFHPRCPHATEECKEQDPELREVSVGRYAACLRTKGYDAITTNEQNEEVKHD